MSSLLFSLVNARLFFIFYIIFDRSDTNIKKKKQYFTAYLFCYSSLKFGHKCNKETWNTQCTPKKIWQNAGVHYVSSFLNTFTTNISWHITKYPCVYMYLMQWSPIKNRLWVWNMIQAFTMHFCRTLRITAQDVNEFLWIQGVTVFGSS